MTTAVALSEKDWLALSTAGHELPRPFERTIELGTFDVEGVLHIDNPTMNFRKLGLSGRLNLRVGESGSCELVFNQMNFGWLPQREGVIFNRLLQAGKSLVARPVRMNAEGLEPELSVRVEMEEF